MVTTTQYSQHVSGHETHLTDPSFHRFYSNKYFLVKFSMTKELIKGLKVNNGMNGLQFELCHLDRNRSLAFVSEQSMFCTLLAVILKL